MKYLRWRSSMALTLGVASSMATDSHGPFWRRLEGCESAIHAFRIEPCAENAIFCDHYFAPTLNFDASAHSVITVKYRCTPSAPTTKGLSSPTSRFNPARRGFV